MILSLMYHHVNKDLYSNDFGLLDNHFRFLSENYRIVFPDEYRPSCFGRLELCLVFDDGYYDFYHYVFPLLLKFNIKAVLSVVPKYVLEDTSITTDQRLSLSHSEMMKDNNFIRNAPFCTWKEIVEMSASGFVQIASHGLNHIALTELSENDAMSELEISKKIIESKTGHQCGSFVYPYGCFNRKIQRQVRTIYRYDFAIGGAYNCKLINETIYRIYADDMSNFDELFTLKNRLKYLYRMLRFKCRRMVI